MKYLGVLTVMAVIFLSWLTNHPTATAISSSVVISQIQLGVSGNSKQEYVQLHNNADASVNITDWCVTYSDFRDESRTTLKCFAKPTGVDELRVPAFGNVLLASQSYTLPLGVVTAERFANASTDMSGARGHVRVVRANGEEVDKVAWDNKASAPPVSPEGIPAPAPATGKSIARSGTNVLVDTDNNQTDLHEQLSLPLSSDLFEYVAPRPVIDLCQQEGIQETLPEGYGYDEAGNCELLSADKCLNLEKIQLEVPQGMLTDSEQNCFLDVCLNIPDLQKELPTGYVQNNGTCTEIEKRVLLITEILANASGTDAGQEYIEIYNPHTEPILMAGYVFNIGKNFEKAYQLVDDEQAAIKPNEYLVFRDDQLHFTLLNTSSGVRLTAPAGNIVSEASYENPKDDMSWSLLGDSWTYTNVPTPAQANQPSIQGDEEVLSSTVTLAPCGPGKYRNPVTNRCRSVEADAAVLASCDADEYRNPETNRCRKIASLASATLAACEEGYERNPDTNRCRKVASSETELKACEAGYERNPETNRCRAVTTTSKQASSFSPAEDKNSSLTAPVILTVVTVALGYAVYEWRRELTSGWQWVASKIKH